MEVRAVRRSARGAGRYGRLLLLAALLLGFVTMHTWGHPPEHAGAGAHAAVASSHGAPAHDAPAQHVPEDVPGAGMDPTTACLFLLGSAGAGLLGGLALRRLRRRSSPYGAWSTRLGRGRARRPHRRPPPLRVALAELSVLRI
ncbi:DUF6153 family protein [Streptomyces sp. CC77]|uniref:DUF6153 family protein n=1 Tax=Streptomyces sp. CC77 TaxID=1906739 RepID=UPI0008DE3095|nr:DUF6153 family protein [Streptomyces sp. CC77]OII65952.1 hypothetical protein BJP39_28725 [Streptomyces sp. CC77]